MIKRQIQALKKKLKKDPKFIEDGQSMLEFLRKSYPEYGADASLDCITLGQCYMKMKDVIKFYPNFKPKSMCEMLDEKGRPTKEVYVKCSEVKAMGDEDAWKNITDKHQTFFDWYALHRDGDIRLIASNKNGETTATAEVSESGNFASVTSSDGSSAKAEATSTDGKKATAEINTDKYQINLTDEQLSSLAQQIKVKTSKKLG